MSSNLMRSSLGSGVVDKAVVSAAAAAAERGVNMPRRVLITEAPTALMGSTMGEVNVGAGAEETGAEPRLTGVLGGNVLSKSSGERIRPKLTPRARRELFGVLGRAGEPLTIEMGFCVGGGGECAAILLPDTTDAERTSFIGERGVEIPWAVVAVTAAGGATVAALLLSKRNLRSPIIKMSPCLSDVPVDGTSTLLTKVPLGVPSSCISTQPFASKARRA